MNESPGESAVSRRSAITEEIARRTGIDEAMIRMLVTTFYARVRLDLLIGPIFAEKIQDWEQHIEKLCTFWSSVALMTGRYHGQPMRVHLPLPIENSHFERWLEIFEATAVETCPPAACTHFMQRARQIADSLELGISMKRGEIKTPRWVVSGHGA